MKMILINAFKCVLILVIFIVISILFAIPDFGSLWDNLDSNFGWGGYLTLIGYRLAIYTLPGFLLWCIFKKKGIVFCYEIQFITYAIIKLFWEFLALDYIFSTEIFSKLDSSIVIVGLFLSLVLNKRVKLKTELI